MTEHITRNIGDQTILNMRNKLEPLRKVRRPIVDKARYWREVKIATMSDCLIT
jgi:hypothetical protein